MLILLPDMDDVTKALAKAALRLATVAPIPPAAAFGREEIAQRLRVIEAARPFPSAKWLRHVLAKGDCWTEIAPAARRLDEEALGAVAAAVVDGGSGAEKLARAVRAMVHLDVVRWGDADQEGIASLAREHLAAMDPKLDTDAVEVAPLVPGVTEAISNYNSSSWCFEQAAKAMLSGDEGEARDLAARGIWLERVSELCTGSYFRRLSSASIRSIQGVGDALQGQVLRRALAVAHILQELCVSRAMTDEALHLRSQPEHRLSHLLAEGLGHLHEPSLDPGEVC